MFGSSDLTCLLCNDAVIEFASVINQTDHVAQDTSLEELRIPDLRKEELLKVLLEGF